MLSEQGKDSKWLYLSLLLLDASFEGIDALLGGDVELAKLNGVASSDGGLELLDGSFPSSSIPRTKVDSERWIVWGGCQEPFDDGEADSLVSSGADDNFRHDSSR